MLLIPANARLTVELHSNVTVNNLQQLVGGYIESAPTRRDDITLYAHEEGLLLGRNPNLRASRIAQGGFVVGDAIVVGAPGSDGNHTNVPTDLIHQLMLTHDTLTR